ncbi:phage tail tube protein [Microbulbifer thermotolerans]|uniref:Phage tail tube protein n=1 Tax=Microbulbifer thermotolerans TaxID=252514 RepID=A0AB35HXG8_MICTH|nr:phage tail tube protein [Microbulbifer thermotolerans]MCX2780424.1 phage tail tube protein [Microbulbifer thermotolerans]MCX2802258.1 phage tail tube protein [Microbulbifer thermotolerans]MCX2805904.1 phage tail tube protein [Microbulbifer thermotolerans]
MAKLVKRELILVKIESSYGVDATPGASDAILVENIGWSFAGARMVERAAVKPSLGMLQGIFAGTLMEVTFDVEVKGSGAAGTAPEVGPLLRACGMAETIDAGTSVEYAPASAGHESVTLYYYEDGSVYKLTGCRGTVSVNLETGAAGKFSFTITGHVSGPTDAAMPTVSYDATTPPPVINASFSVGSYSAVINALSLDLGNTIATPPSMSAEDGYSEIIISDRDVTGSFDPEATTVAAKNWAGEWKAGTAQTITTGTIGSTAGNQYELEISSAWYKELSPGDRDGLRTYEIGFGAAGDDDAFKIIFS